MDASACLHLPSLTQRTHLSPVHYAWLSCQVGTAIGCVSLYALLILGRALGKLACRKDRTGTGGTATRLPPSSVMVIDSMAPNAGH